MVSDATTKMMEDSVPEELVVVAALEGSEVIGRGEDVAGGALEAVAARGLLGHARQPSAARASRPVLARGHGAEHRLCAGGLVKEGVPE